MQSETSIKLNKIKSDEIAAKVAEFKAKGGQVYQAAIGESGFKEWKNIQKQNVVRG